MSDSSTSAAVCSVCGHRHWMRDPHIWGDEPKKAKVAELKAAVECVHNGLKGETKCVHSEPKAPEKCVHIPESGESVYTMRQVSIRNLRANLAGELNDLPFEVIKNGRVIARVTK